jgi:hypothetical protein
MQVSRSIITEPSDAICSAMQRRGHVTPVEHATFRQPAARRNAKNALTGNFLFSDITSSSRSGGGSNTFWLEMIVDKGFEMEMWVRDGAVVARPVKGDGSNYPDKVLLDQFNMVKVESAPTGTLVQWNMACANWASLLFAVNLVSVCPAPVRVKYFNAGWFEEEIETAVKAAARIESLVFKSDVRFSQRVYLTDDRPALSRIPDELRTVMESGEIPDQQSIQCKVDMDTGMVDVESIGEKSLLGKVWGMVPISYPAMTGHSYDRVVSQPYFHVLRSGKMHYDQVLASMIMPDGERHWFSYHRVILPETSRKAGVHRVKVACARAPVDITLL